MLNKFSAVQECDATADAIYSIAGYIKFFYLTFDTIYAPATLYTPQTLFLPA